jgi:DnaJ-class molecular chaperone
MSAPLAATAAALIVALIAVARWIRHPWSVCARCNGEGHREHLLGGRLPCRRCGGSGQRTRVAYRVIGGGMRLVLKVQRMRAEARADR